MPDITPRQALLLSLIVREFVEWPKNSGVSSKTLVEKFGLDFSSATVRNEMVMLTEAGMLHQPHTSAGRIPTETGYRYFVQRLVRDETLPALERHLISHQFHQARASVDQWSRLAAAVLASHAGAAALVTTLHGEHARFKHMELVATRDLQVLIVLVLQSGEVLQQMLTLDTMVGQEYLSVLAQRITNACHDLDCTAINHSAEDADPLEAKVLEFISGLMMQADTLVAGEVHVDGVQNVLAEREFIESENARQALSLLDEHTFMERFLTEALRPQIGAVQVVIAGEGGWHELQECSMVIARYGAAEIGTGALGVFGPTRMAYERAIGTVRYVAKLMTDLVCETYGLDTGMAPISHKPLSYPNRYHKSRSQL